MAITQETLNAARRARQEIRDLTDRQMVELVSAWAGAWDSIVEDFTEALADLETLGGGSLTRQEMARNRKLVSALNQAEEVLTELFELTDSVTARDLLEAVHGTIPGQRQIIQSQLPTPDAVAPGVNLSLNAPAPDALNAIIKRSTETIHSLTTPLAPWVAEKMKQELVRGVVLGKNPRAVASRLIKNAEGQFNGGLSRALNIARTEMLDAHREATRVLSRSNADILTSWVWTCTLDARTCPSCLSKHGTEFPLDEFGPIDHQLGRCARVDKVKSWKELGFDIEEPRSSFQDSREWFDNLTEGTQREIMGPTRFRLLHEGKISWDDLATLRKTNGWRDSWGVRPVKDLLDLAGESE